MNPNTTNKHKKKTFTGKVVVSSGDGSTGVSGSIGAMSAEDFDENTLQSNRNQED